MRIWLAIVIGSALSIAALWCTTIPLGIPSEWTWDRSAAEPDLIWNVGGGIVAAGIIVAFVVLGFRRLDGSLNHRCRGIEVGAWLAGLVAVSFIWLWIVQELTPIKSRLGKAAFVLYYPSSSGYFTRARYITPDAAHLLTGYEDLMREGDVLHIGTHPPGLFLIFHGLIAACEKSPSLSEVLDSTQPYSFREACDVIAANNFRRAIPRPLLAEDRRVLWLATLLVMLAASLVVIPLYGLLSRGVSRSTAWACAALWPAVPAVAIFIPKSDTVFPLLAVTLLWIWLSAWDRRSVALAMMTGILAWCGLFCSLAFLPVLLAAAIMTVGSIGFDSQRKSRPSEAPELLHREPPIGIRRGACVVALGFGFALPTVLLYRFASINLLNVWWLNYQNHAGFYQHYARTYWKWLLANPIETSFAVGWPVALLALIACWRAVRRTRDQGDPAGVSQLWKVIGPIIIVWGLLWITGKNSGESARIWILFVPWLIWMAGLQFEAMLMANESFQARQRRVVALLLVQYLTCLLTVARVSGFHADAS